MCDDLRYQINMSIFKALAVIKSSSVFLYDLETSKNDKFDAELELSKQFLNRQIGLIADQCLFLHTVLSSTEVDSIEDAIDRINGYSIRCEQQIDLIKQRISGLQL